MFESFLGINFLNLYDTDAFLAVQIILTLTINCIIFRRMTDIRISWTVFLTLALLDVAIQYNITNLTTVVDVFLLMILAVLAKGKTWSLTQYAFHTLFPVVTSDLLFRLLGLFFFPLLLNIPIAEVGSNAFFYLLTYSMILPLYFIFNRFLGLDLKRWKVYSDDSLHNIQISRRVALAMAIYLLGIYLCMNLDVWFPFYSPDLELRFRMLWVLLSAVAFIFLIAHLNQLSRQYLEESLAMEEKRHLNSLTKANQKIDLLYNELLQYRQSYQTVVEQFSEEVRD
ncbi:MAG: GHKL domain-containing protein, partial [Streptococcus sp.]|nr:GHKL domain-containing protein [Streptococcus sp.]